MEEDIKILEKMINEIIEKDDCNLFETLSPLEIALKIKKLLQGYRGLEENNIPKSVVEKQLDITMNERSMLGYKTFIQREDMIREDSILLGKEEAYKELLKGDK